MTSIDPNEELEKLGMVPLEQRAELIDDLIRRLEHQLEDVSGKPVASQTSPAPPDN